MRKQIAAFLIPSVILGVLLHDVVNTPFYSEAELRRVSEDAVAVARQGDTADALKRFQALVDVAPASPAVWSDYLVVLPWAGEAAKALEYANQLPFPIENLPAYTQRSLFESALREKRLAAAQRYAQLYIDKSEDVKAALIDSVTLLLKQSQPAMALALMSRYENNFPEDQALVLRRVAAQLQLDNPDSQEKLPALIIYATDKPFEREILSNSLVNASRFRTDDRYLAALKKFYLGEKNAYYAADYLTVLVWHGKFPEAVAIYDQWRAELPVYARKAAMQALAETGRNDDAVQLFSRLNNETRITDDERKLFIAALIANGGASQAFTLLNNETALPFQELRWQALAQLQRDEELFAAIGEQLKQQPDDDLSLRWLAVYQRLIKQNRLPDIESLIPVIRVTSPRVQDEVIRDLIVRNQFTSARRVAIAVDREKPFWLMISQAAGEARQQKNYFRALDLYRFAMTSKATVIDAELGVVLTLRAQGRTLDAISVMDSMLQRYPDNRVVADTAVDLYRSAGDNRRLLPLFEKTWLATGNMDYLRSWIGVVQSGNPYASLSEQRAAIATLQQRYPQNNYLKLRLLIASIALDQCVNTLDFPLQQLTASEVEQVAFAMRRCGNLPLAQQLYAYGQTNYPRNPVFPAGLILTDIAQNEFIAAKKIYDSLTPQLRNTLDVQLAYAWWLAQQQRHAAAAKTYQQLAKQYPANREAFVGQVMNTQRAGQVDQAWALAELHDEWFSSEELAGLQADRIAATLRQAMEKSADVRNTLLTRALNQIDSYEKFLVTRLPDDGEKARALRWDKQLALHLSGEHQAVLDDYAQASVAFEDTPVYALLTLADSQAALNQYAEAEQTLTTVLQREPANPRALKAMYYVHLSRDNYLAAEQVLLSMKSLTPEPLDSGTGMIHWAWRQQAMFEAYRNRLADAETILNQLQLLAPNDANVRQDLALIKRWRGQPEAALALYEQNILQQKNTLDSRIGRAHALLEDRQHRAAGEQVALLSSEHETHPQVKELQRRWDVHNLREFDSRLLIGQSSPDDRDPGFSPNNEYVWESYIFDNPVYSESNSIDYRFFAHHVQSKAEFDEPQKYRQVVASLRGAGLRLPNEIDIAKSIVSQIGDKFLDAENDGRIRRIGVGGDFNIPEASLTSRVEYSQSLLGESDKGVLLNSYWRPDDYWTFGGELQTWSSLVPIRAVNAGVDGKSAVISLAYRENESTRFDFSSGIVSMEGGTPHESSGVFFEQNNNVRNFANFSMRQRIYSDEIHTLDVIPAIYVSKNSSQDVVYFSPERDRAATLSLDYEGLIWRDNLWRFKHHVNVGIGDYQQWSYVWWDDSIDHTIQCSANYPDASQQNQRAACINNPPTRSGGDLIWDWQYEHLWWWSDTVRFNYGVLHRKRSYDGDMEDQEAIFGGINVRF